MGNRDITANITTESENSNVIVALLVYMDFGSSDLYTTTAAQAIDYNGNTYYSTHGMGEISAVEETSELSTTQVEFSLSGIPTANISDALQDTYQGREVTVHLAFFNNDYSIYDTPVLLYKGEMDNMEIVLGKEATITVRSFSILSNWEIPKVSRFNLEDQKIKYPNDKGLEFVEQISSRDLTWTPKR